MVVTPEKVLAIFLNKQKNDHTNQRVAIANQ